MLVTIRLFAGAAQIVGLSKVELDMDNDHAAATKPTSSVGEIARQLSAQYPQLNNLLQTSRWAIEEEFVELDFQVDADRVLVMIPPVSGG